jgi:hypothetical protein
MGYGSDNNIFVYNSQLDEAGQNVPLLNPTVTIAITEALELVTSAFKGKPGSTQSPAMCSFQLNGWSQLTSTGVAPKNSWQQYIFTITKNSGGSSYTINSMINTWPAYGVGGDTINTTTGATNQQQMISTTVNSLENIYLIFELFTDINTNINAVRFTVYDGNTSLSLAETLVQLLDLVLDEVGNIPVTLQDLAPMAGFSVVLVGQYVGFALFSAGAGTITYYQGADGPQTLATSDSLPADSDAGQTFGWTDEVANTWYSSPTVNSDGWITQNFGVSLYDGGAFLAVVDDAATSGQTDLFAVNTAGQLTWFNTENAQAWMCYPPISPPDFAAPSGAPLAVSQQFGTSPSQTDVFVADANGVINLFYTQGFNNWNSMQLTGTVAPGAPLAASQRFGVAGQTDVYAVNVEGQIVCYSLVNNGPWSGAAAVSQASTGFLAPQGAFLAVSQQFGANNQTDVFVVDSTGALNMFSINGAGTDWAGPNPITGSNFAPPGAFVVASPQYGVANLIQSRRDPGAAGGTTPAPPRTDVFVVDHNGALHVFWIDEAGIWNDQIISPAPPSEEAAAPAGAPLAVSQQILLPIAGLPKIDRTDVFTFDPSGNPGVYSADGDKPWTNTPETFSGAGSAAAQFTKRFLAAGLLAGSATQTDLLIMWPFSAGKPAWPIVWSTTSAGKWNQVGLLLVDA